MTFEDPRIAQLRKLREKASLGGGHERIDTQHAKGKLTRPGKSGSAFGSRYVSMSWNRSSPIREMRWALRPKNTWVMVW